MSTNNDRRNGTDKIWNGESGTKDCKIMTLEEIKHNVDLHTAHLKLKLDELIMKQDMLYAAVEQWSKQGYSVVSSMPTFTTSISSPLLSSTLLY